MRKPDLKRGDSVIVIRQFCEVPKDAVGKVEFVREVCFDHHKNHYGWVADVTIKGKCYEIEIEYLEKADAITRLGSIEP